MEKYVYPKFSEYEIPGLRIAGAGLGNLLFIYCRALIFAKQKDRRVIAPTWLSFRIGTWVRHEKDKRLYNNLFQPATNDIVGGEKWRLLFTRHKSKYVTNGSNEDDIILFTYEHMKMNFDDLIDYHDFIYNELKSRLQPRNMHVFEENFDGVVSVHVRLGDFLMYDEKLLTQGKNSIRTSIDWYVETMNKIKTLLPGVRFYIFSDGSDEELKKILAIKDTRRVFYGTSIADVFAMSNTNLIISSGSSFSLWARFLGQTSCIAAPNQLKCRTLADSKMGFEIELNIDEELSATIKEMIRNLYNKPELFTEPCV